MSNRNSGLKSVNSFEKNKISKVDALNNLSKEIETKKPKHSLKLSREAYILARELDYKAGVARSLFRMGRACWLIGDFENAISYLFESIDSANEINNKEYEVKALNVLGNINLDLQNFDISLKYYMRALKLAKAIEYKRLYGILLNNIGEIYNSLKEYETALKYYNKSIEELDASGYESEKGVPTLNIGQVYYNLGEYELAKQYHELSLKISCDVDDRIGESYSLHLLARVYQKKSKNDKALDCYYKSLEIFAETEDRFNEIEVLVDIHKILIEKKDLDKAVQYLERGLQLAEEVKANNMIAKICSCFATLYEEIGEYERSIYFYKKFHDTEIEEKDTKLVQKLNSVTAQFKMERSQQEKEIYRLKNIELRQKTNELEAKTKELEESYRNITIISRIGQNITSTLNLDKILNTVYENVNDLMDATTFGIGVIDEEHDRVKYEFFIEESERLPEFSTSLDNPNSYGTWCIRNRKEIMINDIEKDYRTYMEENYKYVVGLRNQSIIYYPLMVENTIVGMITVQSKTRNAYTKYNLDTIKALASYIAIAINNAKKSQKLSKEIQERKEAQRQLEKANIKLINMSKLDGLTNIPNRRKFNEKIEVEWNRLRREKNYVSLMLIDIDYFKEYNDNYGHLAGDYSIIKVAKTLQNTLKRATDFVARYGGDEFVAVLPYTDTDGAMRLAGEMKEEIALLDIEHKFSGVANHISITIGISTIIPNEKSTIEEFINMADKALYHAKKKGRSRVEALERKG